MSNASRPSEHPTQGEKCQNAYVGSCTVVPYKIVQGFLKKNLNASIDLLSIPHRGKHVKTLRWDHRLQRQNLFMALKRVPRW